MTPRQFFLQTGCLGTLAFLLLFSPLLAGELSPPESRDPADEKYREASRRLEDLDRGLSLRQKKILGEVRASEKGSLSPSLRRLYEERQRLKGEADYWGNIVRLKKDILNLPVNPGEPVNERRREAEAASLAKMAIDGFKELQGRYEMIRPALFHNLLVNMKIKEEGLCWHWARDMIIRLRELNLKEYDLHWASAREGTIREHNTAVVTSRGMPLEEGLFLDGWTHAGKPYWMLVKKDKKHPWKPGRTVGLE